MARDQDSARCILISHHRKNIGGFMLCMGGEAFSLLSPRLGHILHVLEHHGPCFKPCLLLWPPSGHCWSTLRSSCPLLSSLPASDTAPEPQAVWWGGVGGSHTDSMLTVDSSTCWEKPAASLCSLCNARKAQRGGSEAENLPVSIKNDLCLSRRKWVALLSGPSLFYSI